MRTPSQQSTILNPGAAPAEKARTRSEAARARRGDPLPDALSYHIEDAARITGLGRTTVFDLLAKGKLRRIKIGGRTLVEGDSLRALLRGEQKVEG